jgi:hypothetical protein
LRSVIRLRRLQDPQLSDKLLTTLTRKIEAKLCQMRWSPEQISGWLSEQGIQLKRSFRDLSMR